MTGRAIARVARLFVVLFALLAAAQLYLALVAGPALVANPHNPRLADLEKNVGPIVASDGTILAQSVGGKRSYPLGAIAAHVVGYRSARYGTTGIEDAFDSALLPPLAANDPVQQLRAIADPRARRAPQGARIVTTLDVTIQQTLATALGAYPRAAGVVLDPRTGAVLALASVPSYDPNALGSVFASLRVDPSSPLLDRATDGLYPPGSTFKTFTASVALADGVATPQSTYGDPGYFSIGNYTVHDDEGEATGMQTLAGAFALSSNVDFAQIALAIGFDRWYAGIDAWGIGKTVPFDLPIARDRVPPRADANESELAQMGFGQGSLLVTPMRMALIAATIANGGRTMQPFVVRAVERDGHVQTVAPRELTQPVSTEVATTMRDLMVGVVARGTGTAAALPDVTVAGKTGTATNPLGKAHAWFIAFAPAEAPRVALAVVVENAGYGGAVSAPIARTVLRAALARSEAAR